MSKQYLLRTIERFAYTAIMLAAAAVMLAGCALNTDFKPAPPPAAYASFKELDGRWAAVSPATLPAQGQWWQVFGDTTLDDLVTRAGHGNTSIAAAQARLAQARALSKAADANRLPQLGLGAGASRATVTPGFGFPPGAALSQFSVGAGASWEPDLFGRLSKATDAASLDAQSREALLASTRLLIQSEVANTYFALRALDAERALVRQTVVAYRDTLKLTERRFRAGDVAELDVARVHTEVSATESAALALDRRRAELEHALALLLGEPAGSYTLAEAAWDGALPIVPPGVPSVVLARRPDVLAAQRTVLAAQARAGIARTAWFPDISLTGNGGYAANDIGDLFKWSTRAWGVGMLLQLPIFDGGKRQAGLDNANAQWDEAAVSYREQVLVAFRDVEDQLSALRLLADQAEAQTQAVDSAARATALSGSRYRNGYVSQLELLDAQRSELANRRQSLQVRAARYEATVGLIRALGGGWGDAAGAKVSGQSAGADRHYALRTTTGLGPQ
ncbi:MAG TPA: efflux transporter outer membrane subunit [Burkholderiales bacterium]|nr:efflux transporter outer membrane subunit [Burkholderiales bacterium]